MSSHRVAMLAILEPMALSGPMAGCLGSQYPLTLHLKLDLDS